MPKTASVAKVTCVSYYCESRRAIELLILHDMQPNAKIKETKKNEDQKAVSL